MISSSVVPVGLLFFIPRLCHFQVHKGAPLLPPLPAQHCAVAACFPLKRAQSQNGKHPLQGFPSFILPPFFSTRSKAKSHNVSAVGGGEAAEPTAMCHVCVSNLLIYSFICCVPAVGRGHAEVASACTSQCLKWSRSTTSVMTTETATGMMKMNGDLVRHSLTCTAPVCAYLFFPGLSVLPAAFSGI